MKNALRVLVVLAIFGVVGYLMSASNYIENEFASSAEMRMAPSHERIGIPAWLPESSRQIRKVLSLDTPKVMVRFEMPEGTKVAVPDDCRRVTPSELGPSPMSRDWWPKEIPQAAESFYACPSGQYIALSKATGYAWGNP